MEVCNTLEPESRISDDREAESAIISSPNSQSSEDFCKKVEDLQLEDSTGVLLSAQLHEYQNRIIKESVEASSQDAAVEDFSLLSINEMVGSVASSPELQNEDSNAQNKH